MDNYGDMCIKDDFLCIIISVGLFDLKVINIKYGSKYEYYKKTVDFIGFFIYFR